LASSEPAAGGAERLAINQAQLVLAEKRTYLAMLHTGIAVLALPLGVVSFLITFSAHYEVTQVAAFLAPLLGACLVLAVLGAWLCWRAIYRLRAAARRLELIKPACGEVAEDI